MDEMSEDENPIVKKNQKFQREHLKELTHVTTTLNHYKEVVRKLGRYLYPNQVEQMDLLELNSPLLKPKSNATWEYWEVSHPKMGRASYDVDPQHLCIKEIMEGQLQWRKNQF